MQNWILVMVAAIVFIVVIELFRSRKERKECLETFGQTPKEWEADNAEMEAATREARQKLREEDPAEYFAQQIVRDGMLDVSGHIGMEAVILQKVIRLYEDELHEMIKYDHTQTDHREPPHTIETDPRLQGVS